MHSQPQEIEVVFEDDDVLVISKPAGMTVNRADTTKDEVTVQDWAEQKLGIKRMEKPKEPVKTEGTLGQSYPNLFYDRGGIVHRLDKETSGILLLAKNPEVFAELQRQFKERIVKKTYRALVHGKVSPSEGEINVPVGRLPWNRRQFGVVAGGREAMTRYKALETGELHVGNRRESVTLLELYPETGRTHQIRVHLKYLGYPIFADFLYAGRKTQRDDRKLLSRVFLHASKLSFMHPRGKTYMSFESPLPEELQSVLLVMQKSAT